MDIKPYTDAKGRIYRFGEFFPPEFSPFPYNESGAHESFALTKKDALDLGYNWQEPEKCEYAITKKPQELPDAIEDAPESIVKETIGCAHGETCNENCSTAFKIIPTELHFYQRLKLPLPRLCPNCRHYQRLLARNPMKLWKRKCQCKGVASENALYTNVAEHFHQKESCPNEFETSFSPEKKEIVYCESCYHNEVA